MSNKFILRIDASKFSLSLVLRLQKGKFYKKQFLIHLLVLNLY